MKKVIDWIKRHKIATGIIIFILIVVILITIYIITTSHGSIYGDRCKDNDEYAISSSTLKKVRTRINDIEEVNDIDIYSKLCTIKIIINLSKDVNRDDIKKMSNDLLSYFSKDELKYYDFALYVTSDDENSKTYPINVSKHKTSNEFAW